MNWKQRRSFLDKAIYAVYILTILSAIAVTTLFLTSQAKASSYDDIYTPIVTFRAGDLITLPNRKGNFVMLLWGERPIFYNGETEWFQEQPIRNYQSVYVDVTRQIPEGDYQFLEVMVEPGTDPNILANWRWIREYKARIVKCDQFKNWGDAACSRPAIR